MSKADSPTRICGEPDCGRPLRARGLCSTHYNQEHQPDRHRKVLVRCTRCGVDCEKERSKRKPFCSLACRDLYRMATPEGQAALAAARAAAATAPRSPRHRQSARWKLYRAAKGTRGGGIWSMGPCAHCGETFVRHSTTEPTAWCSKACRNAAHARRHNKGKGKFSRLEVFKRDGWRCHLCGKLTDRTKRHPHPMAPTIDHLIPQVDGGPDVLENVRTAHSLCNSKRRQFGTVQLLLFGEVA